MIILNKYVNQEKNIFFFQLFFEGVQAKVGAGVKESEVSYQMAFSKQELRRVVKEYPAREVKKGLENLYRKVEKHLCEEENLLQVWNTCRRDAYYISDDLMIIISWILQI